MDSRTLTNQENLRNLTNTSNRRGFTLYIYVLIPIGIMTWILLNVSKCGDPSLTQKGDLIQSQTLIAFPDLNQDKSASMYFNISGNTNVEFRLHLPLSTFFYSGVVITFPDMKTIEIGGGKSLCRMRQFLTRCLRSGSERGKNCWKPSRAGLGENETIILHDILMNIVLCSENL